MEGVEILPVMRGNVTTVTVPTPIQPTPSCLRHSRAIRTIPEPLCQSRIPSSLTRSSSRLINASRTLWPHPEPVRVLATHPEPSGFIPSQFASHQRTPEPSDPLASRQRIPDTIPIPDPTPLCPSSFSCVKSIPDNPSVSRLRLGEARSRTSLARSVLACPFSPSIYLSLPLSAVRFLCLIVRYPSLVSLSHPQFSVSVYP